MCGTLLEQGKRKRTSAVVDHTRPHHLYEAGHFDPGNLRSVCKGCHDGPCRSIEDRYGDDVEAIERAKLAYRPVGLDGYPVGGVSEFENGSILETDQPI